jgi:hypothetical protein
LSGLSTSPARAAAKYVSTYSSRFQARIEARSPGARPRPAKCAASRLARASSSAYATARAPVDDRRRAREEPSRAREDAAQVHARGYSSSARRRARIE